MFGKKDKNLFDRFDRRIKALEKIVSNDTFTRDSTLAVCDKCGCVVARCWARLGTRLIQVPKWPGCSYPVYLGNSSDSKVETKTQAQRFWLCNWCEADEGEIVEEPK